MSLIIGKGGILDSRRQREQLIARAGPDRVDRFHRCAERVYQLARKIHER
jgi:hypothetical protein